MGFVQGGPARRAAHTAIDLLRGREVLGGPPGRAAVFSKCHVSWSTEGAWSWGLQPVQVPRGVKRGLEGSGAVSRVSRALGSSASWARSSTPRGEALPLTIPPQAKPGQTFLRDQGPRPAARCCVCLHAYPRATQWLAALGSNPDRHRQATRPWLQ